jgi:hypothetical protein
VLQGLLSEIPFGSLLIYATKGQSVVSKTSKLMALAVKFGKAYPSDGIQSEEAAMDFIADHLKACVKAGRFSEYFSSAATLVPMPQSSEYKPGLRWPTMEIAKGLLRHGLGGSRVNYLERFISVRKYCRDPLEHFRTMRTKNKEMLAPDQITIIDDVITSGAHMIAGVSLLRAAFPDSQIRSFAIARTQSEGEAEGMVDPREGEVTLQDGGHRASRWP